jgi:hypothetical protein
LESLCGRRDWRYLRCYAKDFWNGDDRQRLLAALRTPAVKQVIPQIPPEFRLIRRAEVARRLSYCLRTVDKLAAAGILKKHKLPGRVRASGFLASDVDKLILETSIKENV